MKKGKKIISAAVGFALIVQSFAGVGPITVAAAGTGVDIGTTFTDANFQSFVSSNFDTNNDGSLSEEEIANVTSINVSNYTSAISSMKGIEVFTALESLNCSGQAIKSLDVVDLTNLVSINASNNQLSTFSFPTEAPNLTSVNLSGNLLTEITLQDTTYSSLTSLNVYGNQLNAIDLSSLPALTSLSIGYNALSELDLSKNSNLITLDCRNMTKLSKLDVATKGSVDHTKLKYLDCTYSASGSQGSITELDVSGNTGLISLLAADNSISTLNMQGTNNIALLDLAGNKLTGIDVSQLTNLSSLNLASNNMKTVNVSRNTLLTYLNLSGMSIDSMDVSANTQLQTLELSSNLIATIDVSKNTALTALYLSDNKLEKIDVSKNTELATLKLDNNSLVAIDISSCPKLAEGEFSCTGNSRTITLSEPNYIYNMAELEKDGYVKEITDAVRDEDTVGNACIQLTDEKGNSKVKDGEIIGYTLYPNLEKKAVKYSYYYGLGKGTVDFTLNITNPLYLYVWYTTNGEVTNSGNGALKLKVGDTTTLTAKDKEDNVYSNITWGSSDKNVFTVDSNGLLTCVGEGTASLYVNINNKTRAYVEVDCHKPVTRVGLVDDKNKEYNDGDVIELKAGTWVDESLSKKNLTATCYIDDNDTVAGSEYSGVTYKVTSTPDVNGATTSKVISCTSKGIVTARGAGTAYLHCISNDSGVETMLEFHVTQMGESVSVTPTKTTMFQGGTTTITATVTPDTTANKDVVWSSSDESILTVDENGKVTAKAAGTATVFCKLKDNEDIYARTEVTVNASSAGLNLNYSTYDLVLGTTDTTDRSVTLVAEIEAEDASIYKKTWASSNTSVVTVNASGLVTAKGPGTATVTCTLSDGTVAECQFTVISKVTGLTITKDSSTMYAGNTMTVTVTVKPDNATDSSIAWSSSDPTVAAIAEDGTITAYKKGQTTITCSALDGSGKSSQFLLTVKQQATSVTIDKAAVTVYIGKTETVTAKVLPDTADNKALNWEIDDSDVATVSSGRITGKAIGTATVRATTRDGSNITKEIKVTVLQQINTITLDKTSETLKVGQNASLVASISPIKPSNAGLVWSSDNDKVAKVNSNGVITATGRGSTNIWCKAADGAGAKAQCRVTVTQPVTAIRLNNANVSLFTGKNVSLSATVTPSNANNTKVTWASSNTKVANVSASGYVTAIGAGTTVITCKAQDGSGVIATCKVTVKNPVTSIKLNKTTKSVFVGKTYKLKATVGPKNATSKTVTWKSSNTKVATVSSSGVVKGKKAGTATIYCIAKDGSGVQTSCQITVTKPVTKVKLNKTSVSLKVKKSYTLKVTVGPKSATNKSVTWKSSNKKIATVSQNGTIVAKKKGTVTITVKAKDGSGKSAKCRVKVK